MRPGDVVIAGEESTDPDCAAGGRFHTLDARALPSGGTLRVLDSVAPDEPTSSAVLGPGAGCSAHWFTQQGSLVAASWFGAGLRILDITDPRRVRQVGRYVPAEARTWSAYWVHGTSYVYALDLTRGLDVLDVRSRAGDPEVGSLVHDSRVPDVRTRAELFCELPTGGSA